MPRMFVTDLDGTLLDPHGRLREEERATLETLARLGVPRVVATGRNLHSARRVMTPEFPVDYLVFASGAGIMDWRTQRLLATFELETAAVERACACLMERRLDFMLHAAVPDNHHFHWFSHGRPNADFERRRERYRDYAQPWQAGCERTVAASQFVAIEPPEADAAALHADIAACLSGLNVVRTTSPLDHRSTWIEIFPGSVSKSAGSAWLAARHGCDVADVLAVGNDWNDVDLLEWAGESRVVGNAVADLRARHATVAANDAGGVSEAVRGWLASGGS
ncbi:MAG: HAD family phosphatase [Planctomycetes bacterium]|nr:HAD family phosphatase [Planctomycetota bacterium]